MKKIFIVLSLIFSHHSQAADVSNLHIGSSTGFSNISVEIDGSPNVAKARTRCRQDLQQVVEALNATNKVIIRRTDCRLSTEGSLVLKGDVYFF